MEKQRIEGIDFARTLAFIGMVVVNFKTVLVVEADHSVSYYFSTFLEGKAAACFIVIAGLGIAMSSDKLSFSQILKRAAFLLAIGLVNRLVFEADIIHYYAFYFLFGSLLVGLSIRRLTFSFIVINLVSLVFILLFDYDRGWNWETLHYSGFWTAEGFIRSLFFNGYHPVFPWIGFIAVGAGIAKLKLTETKTQNMMIATGILLIIAMSFTEKALFALFIHDAPELTELFVTGPIPPNPLYMLTGTGAALFTIGFCLKITPLISGLKLFEMSVSLGKQTLSLYFAHIIIGMGFLEYLGYLNEPQSIETALFASFIFVVFAFAYTALWRLKFRNGPIESLMRWATK